ncbi:MAG: exodeoxyribonuclease VII small subunit [Kiritimatiellae bacterium]|nr:exodeoxyribonuclease VII small subunit [Kiritimatiellia bacterium]
MAEKKSEKSEIGFETALKRLEEIVEKMGSGEMDLDAMVAAFEEGQKLVALCTEKLNEVEKKIEKLTKGSDGDFQAVPFE